MKERNKMTLENRQTLNAKIMGVCEKTKELNEELSALMQSLEDARHCLELWAEKSQKAEDLLSKTTAKDGGIAIRTYTDILEDLMNREFRHLYTCLTKAGELLEDYFAGDRPDLIKPGELYQGMWEWVQKSESLEEAKRRFGEDENLSESEFDERYDQFEHVFSIIRKNQTQVLKDDRR